MSELRYLGDTYFGQEVYDGDEIIRTPNGDMLFPDELESYVVTVDDYVVEFVDYDEIQKQEKLRHADIVTDIRRDEKFND